MTEDGTVGCHHQINGHEFGYALEVGDGQRGLWSVVHEVARIWTGLSN